MTGQIQKLHQLTRIAHPTHKIALLDFLLRQSNQTIDCHLLNMFAKPRSYFKQVLLNVTAVTINLTGTACLLEAKSRDLVLSIMGIFLH